MREFAFELRLCARLEARGELVGRQIGAGVRRPANRIVDVVCVEPGVAFAERTAITPEEIPWQAIEADVGAGVARPRSRAFDGVCSSTMARVAADGAAEVGFFELERRSGRVYVRQTARYPDWFGRLRAIENKPDLDEPGDLARQLRIDVALGLFDEIVVATESYVTRAHLNRLPAPVGVWRFDPEEGTIEVVREPSRLPTDAAGVEPIAEHPGRTEIRIASAAGKARKRLQVAERVYGKGWRTYAFPGCERVEPGTAFGVGGLPHCTYHGRPVDPAAECGPKCPGFELTRPPDVDLRAERDQSSPWVADPAGYARRQSSLNRFNG